MNLKNQIEADFISAYKARNDELVAVLRMLKSSIKNMEIAEKQDISDETVLRVLKKEVKQRLDSANEYEKANRLDLANKEKDEAKIIQTYLPDELSDAEVQNFVVEAVSELGATTMADMGKVIALVMKKAGGATDGAKVAGLVRDKLSK